MHRTGETIICEADVVVHKELCRATLSDSGHSQICKSYGYRPFYTYYQIGRTDESDEAETEPSSEGELKSGYEGSHSPFGFIWQVADATGWSVNYILNKVNYQTLIMMLSDAPRYVNKHANKTKTTRTAEEEGNDIAGFFRSKLNE